MTFQEIRNRANRIRGVPLQEVLIKTGARQNPGWLPSIIHQGYEIYCGFDSDAIGDAMANAMIALYPCIKRLRPAHHDWNDVLTSNSIPPTT